MEFLALHNQGYDKAANNVTMRSDTFCSQMNIKPPYTDPATKGCMSYYWNLCNDDAVDYYVNTVLVRATRPLSHQQFLARGCTPNPCYFPT